MVVAGPPQDTEVFIIEAQGRADGDGMVLHALCVALFLWRLFKEGVDEHLELVVLCLAQAQHLLLVHQILRMVEDFMDRLLDRVSGR